MTFNRVDFHDKAKRLTSGIIEDLLIRKFGKGIAAKVKVNTIMAAVDMMIHHTDWIERIIDSLVDQEGNIDKLHIDNLIEDEFQIAKLSIDRLSYLMSKKEVLYDVAEGFIEYLKHADKNNAMALWERYFSEAKGLIAGEQGA